MLPTLKQFHYLVALDETRHFRKAAERCGISQPSLSDQLANLEELLGVQLVGRGRGPVPPTAAGREVIERARSILQDTRDLLPNFTRQAVTDALLSLRIAPLFTGYRGKPPADLDAAIDVVMAVQDLAPRVGTLDINPLLLREKDAIALDCYMTILEDSP